VDESFKDTTVKTPEGGRLFTHRSTSTHMGRREFRKGKGLENTLIVTKEYRRLNKRLGIEVRGENSEVPIIGMTATVDDALNDTTVAGAPEGGSLLTHRSNSRNKGIKIWNEEYPGQIWVIRNHQGQTRVRVETKVRRGSGEAQL